MIYSAEEFVRLRDSTEKDEYDRASMDEAEVSVWLDVIDRYPEYRRWVAYNKTVPLDVLGVLCEFDADVRRFVAAKRKLPAELFERLSRDSSSVVRVAIAANKKTPISIVERLMQDSDEDVASSARYNYENRKI